MELLEFSIFYQSWMLLDAWIHFKWYCTSKALQCSPLITTEVLQKQVNTWHIFNKGITDWADKGRKDYYKRARDFTTSN